MVVMRIPVPPLVLAVDPASIEKPAMNALYDG
jgi:hypothetical protein